MEKEKINEKRRNLDREPRSCLLSPRLLSHPTKTSVTHGQANLRGNLRSRPGLFPFRWVRRNGRDVSALTMDFTHPIAIAGRPLHFDRLFLPLPSSFPPCARFLLFFLSVSFCRRKESSANFLHSEADRWATDVVRIKKQGGESKQKAPADFPCVLPECDRRRATAVE